MRRIYGVNYYVKNILKIENVNQDQQAELLKSLNIDIDGSYNRYQIPKKDGMRDISAIDRESNLYKIQRNLNKNFLSKIPVSAAAIGFVKGSSYNDFLNAHIGKKYYMRMDIKDFFGSINKKHIRDNLSEFVQDSEIIDSIIDICMLEDRIPQGAVTSPAISNIIFRKVDQRIIKYCQSIKKVCISKKNYEDDITYTRYADDMLFSSNAFDFRYKSYFYKMIKKILLDNSFKVNHNKMYFSSGGLSLSGFVISKDVHLSRKRMKNINTILHFFDKRNKYDSRKFVVNIEKIIDTQLIKEINKLELKAWSGQEVKFSNRSQFINYLCGYRAFLISFLKRDIKDTDGINLIKKKVKKIEDLIDKFYECKIEN